MPKKRPDGYLKKSFTIDGRRYYVYGRTNKELFEKEKAKRAEIEKGLEKRLNPTFAEYSEQWLKNREMNVSEATQRKQTISIGTLNNIFIASANKSFGNLKLKEIKPDDLREVQKNLTESRSTSTVNDYMALIKHIFSDALTDREITYNPATGIKMLKRTEESMRNTRHRALTIEEQTAFFSCERAKASHYYNLFRFAVLTGMRAGEIGALKNTDIHDGFIHVQRTITKSASGTYVVGATAKTQAGQRMIPLNDSIKEVLREQQKNNRILFGNIVSLDDTIFKSPQGNLLKVDHADRELKRICKDINIEPLTMHGFRATYATRCIEAGMNPRTLQELLGHTNFNLTMSLYGHVVKNTLKEEAEKVCIIC